ncbi:hypothetical protein [Janthinobacterium fluminis]|uniref:Uncharacterized protein n=1 Tax=Janthinobacterium fluminis TaxID=2987524 RepID=A0ABT5K1M2_9BURK|nr:hypothetical protein [Janthinobacterium fluminis]MDC8758335.1 hypothetical protein [Janthinobacterium fluminis]
MGTIYRIRSKENAANFHEFAAFFRLRRPGVAGRPASAGLAGAAPVMTIMVFPGFMV